MSLASDIAAQVAEHGQDVTVRQTAGGTYDAATDTYSPAATPAEATGVKALRQMYSDRLIDGNLRVRGDQKVITVASDAALGFAIAEGDEVEFSGGEKWRIVAMDREVYEGDTRVAQVWQVRR